MIAQDPAEDAFVQDPYAFYAAHRPADWIDWTEYGLPCALSHRAVTAVLKDRRLGRAPLAPLPVPDRLRPFYDLEAHSLLELEGEAHGRLRRLVLRAFTLTRVAGMEGAIARLCDDLIDRFPTGPFDLLDAYARWVPVWTIADLLGLERAHAPDLLAWSNAMVAMYRPGRTRAEEDAAVAASRAFAGFLAEEMEAKRRAPGDDLLSELIAAEGERLSRAELTSTCVLLLNAGHEATVHALGNAVPWLLRAGVDEVTDAVVEEALRIDPPLHYFDRWVYEDCEIAGRALRRGDRVAALLGAANRDPAAYAEPDAFRPGRPGPVQAGFGAGVHFCVGAPLARLELRVALGRLLDRCDLTLVEAPRFAPIYHFHGLAALRVEARPRGGAPRST
ncbi:MAG: cytochrome P450 [Paracoccaceae bacterium]